MKYIVSFRQKKINLIVIVSRGGLSKSYTVEEALLEEAPLIFTGHVTPLTMYRELWIKTEEEKDCFVVFDDVDTLVMNKTNVALLKQICDTREEKTVRYSSSSGLLQGAPREFETSCKTILLTNTLRPKDPNIKALMTRGHFINFIPTNESILEQLESWAQDKEILAFFGQFVHFAKNFNMRTYKLAEELKKSGIEWKKFVVAELEIDKSLLEIHELLQKYKTDIERESFYSGSRSDYYRKKKLYLRFCSPKIPKKEGNVSSSQKDTLDSYEKEMEG